jgi:hypothetical protein
MVQEPGEEPMLLATARPLMNLRDVPHAGFKVVAETALVLLMGHIVAKGKPVTGFLNSSSEVELPIRSLRGLELAVALSHRPLSRGSVDCHRRPCPAVLVGDVNEQRVPVVLDANAMLRVVLFLQAANHATPGRDADEGCPAPTTADWPRYALAVAVGH